MPSTLELRPRAVDVKFRPGDAYDVRLNGPVGWLAGRSFSATFGADAAVATEDGDSLVVSFSEVLTASHPVSAGAVEWVLTEVGGNDVIVGQWKPSMQGSQSGPIDLDVTLNGIDLDVTLVVGLGSVIDGGTPLGSGPDVIDGGEP